MSKDTRGDKVELACIGVVTGDTWMPRETCVRDRPETP